MSKVAFVSRKITTIVPALKDVNGVVQKSWRTHTYQIITNADGSTRVGLMSGSIAGSTGSIVVADADFTTGVAKLLVGKYEISSNVEYTTGSQAVTATNLAAAINRLPELSAEVDSVDNTKVLITGLTGHAGGEQRLHVVYYGTIENFTLSTNSGYLTEGGPSVGAPDLT